MCDEWMPRLEFALSHEQFDQLPRHPAYRYDYYAGRAWLNPKTHYCHAMLDLTLARPGARAEVQLWPITDADTDWMVELFAAAFANEQPFASRDEQVRRQAAQSCLSRTRSGGDGPWIDRASWAAWQDGEPVGAILSTLLPLHDPTESDAYYWFERPPPEAIDRRLGRPHLTWIFVDPALAGVGVGTTLLDATVRSLLDMGYSEMLTTILMGNDSSLLWHWRNGFQLLASTGSKRKKKS